MIRGKRQPARRGVGRIAVFTGATVLVICALAGCPGGDGGETGGRQDEEGEYRITQIDSSGLVPRQELDVYIRTPGGSAGPEELRIFESAGSQMPPEELKVKAWEPLSRPEEEISLALLLDNSGSMYFNTRGEETDQIQQQRMSIARRAVRYFLEEWSDYQDSLTLAAFNRDFTPLIADAENRTAIRKALGGIVRPEGEEGFTELYESLWQTADLYGEKGGRKVVIILSDGENYPYAEHMDGPHPEYGSRLRTAGDVIEKYRREEVSLFAVSFGSGGGKEAGDEALEQMCSATGGLVFDAADEEELRGAYSRIRGEVAREYRAVCRASTLSSEKKWVLLTSQDRQTLDRKPYWMPLLFGEKALLFTFIPFLAFLLALMGRFFLGRYPWRRNSEGNQLKVIHCSGGGSSHQEIPLEKPHTSIGWREDDDMTLTGEGPEDPDEHVDIFFDAETGVYQLKSPRAVRVNNQLTTERSLQGGDVISIDGTSIVIDLGV